MSHNKWAIGVYALFIVFLLLLWQFMQTSLAIQSVVGQMQSGLSVQRSGPHLVLISQELDNPYWRTVERGARDAASKLGADIEYIGPYRNNPQEQKKLLEKVIAAKADGILAQGMADREYIGLINRAVAQGIPVVTVDTDAPESARLTYVGTDNLLSGRLLGEAVVKVAGTRGEIGVIIGSQEAANQRLRLEGFLSVIKAYPELKVVEVRASNISRIQAAQQAEDLLESYPKLTIMVGTSALDAIGILQAKKKSGREGLLIFGFDDLEETQQAIRRGDIQATVVQKPYLMGYDAVKLMLVHKQGVALPREHYTETGLLTQEDLSGSDMR